jgi:hypothetical protein
MINDYIEMDLSSLVAESWELGAGKMERPYHILTCPR